MSGFANDFRLYVRVDGVDQELLPHANYVYSKRELLAAVQQWMFEDDTLHYLEDTFTWRAAQTYLAGLSTKFPGVLFSLFGFPESEDPPFVIYALDGRSEEAEGKLIWPEPTAELLTGGTQAVLPGM